MSDDEILNNGTNGFRKSIASKSKGSIKNQFSTFCNNLIKFYNLSH